MRVVGLKDGGTQEEPGGTSKEQMGVREKTHMQGCRWKPASAEDPFRTQRPRDSKLVAGLAIVGGQRVGHFQHQRPRPR